MVGIEISHTLIQLLKQILHAGIQPSSLSSELRRRHNLPAAPGRVNLAHAADLPGVVKLLGGKVLPHEEVGLARVDGVAQLLKGVEDDGVGEGLCAAAGGEPADLVGEDVAHHVAAGADAGDADLAALEGFDGGDFGALGSG